MKSKMKVDLENTWDGILIYYVNSQSQKIPTFSENKNLHPKFSKNIVMKYGRIKSEKVVTTQIFWLVVM